MTNEAHVQILDQGVDAWNRWRLEHSDVRPNLEGAFLMRANLSGADLEGVDLSEAHLEGANLSGARLLKADLRRAHLCGAKAEGDKVTALTLRKADLAKINLGGLNITWTNVSDADLSEADLTGADLSGADLRRSKLSGAHLDEADLTWANLENATLVGATLRRADIREAYLSDAHFEDAHLEDAHLEGAKLERTHLCGANLAGANLCRASLVEANVTNAILNNCFVHGIAAWNLQGEPREQLNLIITRSFDPHNEPILTVDDLEISQFIYLILNNRKIRNVIDTMTSRAVLILGRFTPERKSVLEAVRDALRERGYLPMLFDFTPSANRDLTETVQLLANLAKFVVADLTDAKSIPQELSAIAPSLTSLPIQPILLASQREYAMFEHWRGFKSVLHEYLYQDQDDLIRHLDEQVIAPVEKWRQGKSADAKLEAELEEARRANEEKDRIIEEYKKLLATTQGSS